MDCSDPIDAILARDGARRELIASSESCKDEQNKLSKQIPQLKKEGADISALFTEMNTLKETIKSADSRLKEIETEYHMLLLSLPNLPDEDLRPGGKENNEPIRYFGQPHTFDFEPKNHVELCTALGLIDYPRGAKLSGSGFWIYRGVGARLEWALLNYFIDTHIKDGYELVLVPHMLTYECGLTAGQFPKFVEDDYWLESSDSERRLFMLPTAETALVSLHRDEILSEADLPRKYISYTPCYRREAGSYRAEKRGMVRGHQFNKVEMVQYTKPEWSDNAFEELVGKAEALVKGLGFHFRTVKLAAGDCSASMARTYDIEIQIPSMAGYKECPASLTPGIIRRGAAASDSGGNLPENRNTLTRSTVRVWPRAGFCRRSSSRTNKRTAASLYPRSCVRIWAAWKSSGQAATHNI
jgi:seryl-tRNA synthetase